MSVVLTMTEEEILQACYDWAEEKGLSLQGGKLEIKRGYSDQREGDVPDRVIFVAEVITSR